VAALGTEVRHIFEVRNVSGVLVTGLVQANFVVLLRRQDGASSLVTASETVTITEIASGQYWATYTPEDAAALYILTVSHALHVVTPDRWEDSVAAGVVPPSGPWLSTLTNVKRDLNMTDRNDDDARISALLEAVTRQAEMHCGRKLVSGEVTDYLDGRDYKRLVLSSPLVSAVASVHESADEPPVYDSTTLLVAGEDYWLQGSGASGILIRVGRCWPCGPDAVKVVYTAGFTTVPGDLERSAIEIIAVKLSKGRSQRYHATTEERAEDGSVVGISRDDITPNALLVWERYADRRAA